MKRIRAIRRKNIAALNVLFFASVLLFYEIHGGIFLKEFAEKKLEKMLPEASRVEIGKIKGGIFGNLIAENVKISTGTGVSAWNIFAETPVPARIEVDYRLWYPLFGKFPKIPEKKISRFHIMQGEGFIDLAIKRDKGTLLISGKINHVKFHGADIIGECIASFFEDDKGLLNTQITFKDMIINYKPFNKTIKVFASYDRPKDTFNIIEFRVDDDIKGSGYVRPGQSYYVFLKWAVTDLVLEDYFAAKGNEERISGAMNGNFTLKGPIEEAELSAHIAVQDGTIGDLKFDSIIANLKGKGPLISIDDSRILKDGGHIMLGGTLDLSKLSAQKAFDGITFDVKENFFVWKGWSAMQATDDLSVKAEKSLGGDENLALSFESHMKKNAQQEEKHFLGVESRLKF